MIMNYNDIDSLAQNGFEGFKTIKSLMENDSCIPASKGIYMVICDSEAEPSFLPTGSGGHFKGKDPNVPVEMLQAKWIDQTKVIYIGKAGNITGGATLRSRLRQYLKFGQGENAGHWGGRYIWQLEGVRELMICWKVLPNEDPREEEKRLIRDFMQRYDGRLPFANLIL